MDVRKTLSERLTSSLKVAGRNNLIVEYEGNIAEAVDALPRATGSIIRLPMTSRKPSRAMMMKTLQIASRTF